MPRFIYDRERAREEYRLARVELKQYYRWRYGYAPPLSWTADHQVEQSNYLYERFGPATIHNIANMLMVPPEVNCGKNVAYGKPWDTAPPQFRKQLPPTIQQVQFVQLEGPDEFFFKMAPDGQCVEVRSAVKRPTDRPRVDRPLAIREVLFLYSRNRDDPTVWSFMESFSKEIVRRLDIELSQTRWRNDPPEWLVRSPRWLDRFREELETHQESVSRYLRRTRS